MKYIKMFLTALMEFLVDIYTAARTEVKIWGCCTESSSPIYLFFVL